ncbi:MAG: glycosyltransferase family 2 protein [Desulfatiglans sp.]|jgi:GT2 family glycosyltransferase|nr:glycosyltransferase family 2 protein [Desulfatiglans sp.]
MLNNDSQSIPDISIIIVSFNTRELTKECINCVKENSTGIDIEIIVVDNGSKDGSAEMIETDFSWVRLIRLKENRGFAGGNIPGMKIAKGRYILLLNSDAFIRKNTLEKTISYMDQHPDTGILGCKLTDPDGRMQPSARMLPGPLNKFLTITGLSDRYSKSRFFGRVDYTWWDHSYPLRVGWVVGAYFLIRRETMDSIGYLDDRYFLYFEEVDYCLAAKRSGWDVFYFPHTEIVHLGGKSAEKSDRTFSENGKQILKIRLESEWKYYQKFYGWYYAIIVLGIELFWNAVVYIKNLHSNSLKAHNKRENSKQIMNQIMATLCEVYRSYKSK